MTVPALALTAAWPVPHVAAAVVYDGTVIASAGDTSRVFRLASLSKAMTAWATLIAVEEGIVGFDDPVGQPGCTLRHLLSHAGGYPFDGMTPIARPERRRTYSNSGIELAAAAVAEASGIDFATYLSEAVFEPLGMATAALHGSAAHGVHASVDDVVRFIAEAMHPELLAADTAAEASRIQYPALAGIVPGVGRYERCPWGLGFEIRGDKQPHWTGATNSPRTFGHFGGAGTMFWIDPDAGPEPARATGLVALTDRAFDEWHRQALQAWPALSDAVLADVTRSMT